MRPMEVEKGIGEPDLDKMLQDLRQQSSVGSLMLQKEIQWIFRVKREADRRPLDLPADARPLCPRPTGRERGGPQK